MRAGTELQALVAAARRGDERAWDELVTRFTPQVRHVARGFRLQPHDVDDVVQQTWLRAYRHLGGLRDPQAIGAWLMTMTRRCAIRQLGRATVEVLSEEPVAPDVVAESELWEAVVARHRAVALHRAVGRLTPRQRQIIEVLLNDDASYVAAAAGLGIPIGSIGPTRARCLTRLRQDAELSDALAA